VLHNCDRFNGGIYAHIIIVHVTSTVALENAVTGICLYVTVFEWAVLIVRL